MTPTFRLNYRRDAQTGALEFNPVMPMKPETLRFHLEGIAVSVHDQIKMLLGGNVRPYDYYISLPQPARSEEHTSELQSLMRHSYAVFCLKQKKKTHKRHHTNKHNQ